MGAAAHRIGSTCAADCTCRPQAILRRSRNSAAEVDVALDRGFVPVHGDVGTVQKLLQRLRRSKCGEPDGCAHFYLVCARRSGHGVRAADPGPHPLDLRFGVRERAIEHDQELVAAPPANDIRGTAGRAQLVGKLAQNLIAGDVAEGIVDALEAVDIDDRDRKAWRMRLRAIRVGPPPRAGCEGA